jgi:hypothetical protein
MLDFQWLQGWRQGLIYGPGWNPTKLKLSFNAPSLKRKRANWTKSKKIKTRNSEAGRNESIPLDQSDIFAASNDWDRWVTWFVCLAVASLWPGVISGCWSQIRKPCLPIWFRPSTLESLSYRLNSLHAKYSETQTY